MSKYDEMKRMKKMTKDTLVYTVFDLQKILADTTKLRDQKAARVNSLVMEVSKRDSEIKIWKDLYINEVQKNVTVKSTSALSMGHVSH